MGEEKTEGEAKMNEKDREIVALVVTWYCILFFVGSAGATTLGVIALLCGMPLAVIVAGVMVRGVKTNNDN